MTERPAPSSIRSGGWRLLVVSTAVLVGVIHVLPNILFLLDMGQGHAFTMFKPIPDEENYWARIRDIMDGHWLARHALFWEHRNDPVTLPFLPELTLALIGRVAGLSISSLSILTDSLWPCMTFLLTVVFLRKGACMSPRSAYVGALSTVLLSVNIAGIPEVLLWIASYAAPSLRGAIRNEPFWIDRTVSPQFYYPLMLLYLIVYRLVLQSPGKLPGLLLGLILATFSLQSPFFFAFLAAGTGLHSLYLLARGQRTSALRLITACLLATVCAFIPAAYLHVKAQHLPEYREWMRRGVIFLGHAPLFSKRDLLLLVLFPFLPRRRDDLFYFFYAFLVGGVVCTNVQVAFGRNTIPWHYMLYTNAFWAILALSWAASTRAVLLPPPTRRLLAAALCTLLVLNGVFVETRLYSAGPGREPRAGYTWKNWRELQKTAPAIQWLDRNTPPDSVVLAGPTMSILIPVLSHNNVFIHPSGQFALVSTEEFRERLLLMLHTYGVPPDHIPELLDRSAIGNYSLFAFIPRDDYEGRDTPEARRQVRESTRRAYEDLLRNPAREKIRPYRIDYLVVGWLEEINLGQPNLRRTLRQRWDSEPAYSDPWVDIYRFDEVGRQR